MLSAVILSVGLILTVLSGTVYPLGHYGIPGTFIGGCDVCHDFVNGAYAPATGNLRWVRDEIEWPEGTIHSPVNFIIFSSILPADGTLADGDDTKLDGPCEVCHTTTKYHNNSGDGKNHFDATNCTACHPHFTDDMINYFEPRFIGTQSHITHWTDPKGPQLGEDTCTVCHLSTDFHLFADDKPLFPDPPDYPEGTGVCDDCHSPGGAYDGVNDPVIGAKPNWQDAVYKPEGNSLKDGKENWCSGCHDDEPSIINGVAAPNVMGDDATYGYNVSGHGRNPLSYIKCENCHDLSVAHTDGEPRTYAAPDNNYKIGYRLNTGMAIPRNGQYGPNAFELCFKCHIYSDVFGAETNFRDDIEHHQYHQVHLDEGMKSTICFDSDYDGVDCQWGTCADSAPSCTACHQVHGSPMVISGTYYPNPVMIRHGELINKVPALDFHWYDATSNFVTSLEQSESGGMRCGPPEDVSYNNVCWGCHMGVIRYYRTPGGFEGVSIENVWTTDLENNPKDAFSLGEKMRIHVSFTIQGSRASYFVEEKGKVRDSTGTVIRRFKKEDILAPGSYWWTWDRTIPSTATPGSGAKVIATIEAYDAPGGTFINKATMRKKFTIKP